ncbi:MAG: homoprotocatechuate degradation operon regulator HpaR [Rhizobiaceae bacterium]|nr:homoprotocatechuate degradation operon regulator HpaR [Rhizobiaceae bacterium]
MTPETEALPDDSLLPRDTRRSLPMALLRAREAVMTGLRPILAARDVSEQQWRVLRVLAESGPLDATEVAERACLLAPSLTRIMRSLEERRFITRDRDAGDGRRVRLAISAAGLAMISDVVPASRAIYTDIEARFGKERIDLLLDMLGDLALLKP